MWGTLWYLATIVAAFVWLLGSGLASRLSIGELLFASIPVGTIGGAWVVFLVSCLLSQLSPLSVGVASILVLIVIADSFMELGRNARALAAKLPAQRTDLAISLGLAAAVSAVMWPLYSSRMIPERNGALLSGGSCYGDLPVGWGARIGCLLKRRLQCPSVCLQLQHSCTWLLGGRLCEGWMTLQCRGAPYLPELPRNNHPHSLSRLPP